MGMAMSDTVDIPTATNISSAIAPAIVYMYFLESRPTDVLFSWSRNFLMVSFSSMIAMTQPAVIAKAGPALNMNLAADTAM